MSLQLTRKQLATIAEEYGLSEPPQVSADGVSGGYSGAGIWKMRVGEKDYALRRWPRNGLPRRRILGLHRLLQWWNQEGFPELPEPCRTLVGRTAGETTLLCFEGEEWQLEPWMPGRDDFWSDPSEERVRSVMHWLGRLHLVTPRYAAEEGSREWFHSISGGRSPAVGERRALLHSWNSPRIARAKDRILALSGDLSGGTPQQIPGLAGQILCRVPGLIGGIEIELRNAVDIEVPLFPCLRDVWHDHLLFTGDRLTGVVDPSACRTESVASDLSRLLGSLFPFDKGCWDAALNCYSAVRDLTSNERHLIEILDRSGVLLSGLYWTDRIASEGIPSEFDPEKLGERLATIVRRLESMGKET